MKKNYYSTNHFLGREYGKRLAFSVFLLPGLLATSPTLMAGNNSIVNEIVLEASAQQTQTIKGRIIDQAGLPVIGAGVIQQGTKNGAVTDVNGYFSINVPAGTALQITCLGYESAMATAKDGMTIVLKEDSEILSEVVVVGYGAQKRADITGSVATVDVNKALDSRPIADVGRGLQGAVAGMNVRVPSGEVGSDPIIKIRGQIGSINGGSSPLILLDNVEIPSIQLVNPDDIESITVLKDAASSAIYGSKAAFGVVLITTKNGSKGSKLRVSYSNNFSMQNPARDINIGGIEALQYTYDAQVNRESPMPAGGFWRINKESLQKAREWQELYGKTVKWNDPVVYGRDWYFDGTDKYGYRIYDGFKAMVREWAPTMTHNLSVSGSQGNTSFNVGLGYLDQSGMTKPAKIDDFKRYNASFSFTSEVNKYITVRGSAKYSDRNKRYPGVGTTSADPWLYLYRWSPLFPMGVMERDHYLQEPAYEMMASNTDNLRNRYFNLNLGTTIHFTEDWEFQFDYTYDRQMKDQNSSAVYYNAGENWYTPIAWVEDGQQVYVNAKGEVVEAGTEGSMPAYTFNVRRYLNSNNSAKSDYVRNFSRNDDNNTINAFTTYKLTLGDDDQHDFKFMLGTNIVTGSWSAYQIRKNGLIEPENPQFGLASGEQFIESADKDWSGRLGFFGRINYSFLDRYFVEANLRRDGSHKFPTDLQWKWFPAFSGGWIFSKEPFMEPVKDVLSFGKIRASWGSVGDQTVSSSLYKSVLNNGLSNWLDANGKVTTYGTPTLVDADITWQMIETLDFGTDLRFWDDRIGLTFDWYSRATKNMIIPGESLPSTLGASAPKGNYGNLRTNGWEFSFDFSHCFQNGLGINLTATLADATTKITKGADWATPWEDRLLSNEYSTGRRYGDIYGYVTDRLFQRDDFVYGADGKIVRENVIYRGTLRSTNKQNTPNPVYQVEFENGDKLVCAPGDVKFKDLDGDGYISSGSGTNGNPGDRVVIGNSTPRYEYSIRLGANWKGFDCSVFLQGIGKRKIWGAGQLAIPGWNAKEGALPKTFTTDYWYEHYDDNGEIVDTNYDAFYPRAWDLGGSNTGFTMQQQSKYLLNMAYLRVKNITIGYSLPANVLKKIHLEQARIYVSMENFFTFDKLRGLPIDPEAISGYSMFSSNYNLGRTGTGTPMFKSTSLGLQLQF